MDYEDYMNQANSIHKTVVKAKRLERLKSGNYAFGCPEENHEEHDAFCKFPTVFELIKAFVPISEFRMKSRRV